MTPDCSFSYRIAPDARLVLARFKGIVTGRDMLHAAREIHADPDWQDGFDVVWDCSEVEKHFIGPEDVAPLLQEELDSGCGRDALVENHCLSDTLISEMLTSFLRRRGKSAGVYATLEEAMAAVDHATVPAPLRAA